MAEKWKSVKTAKTMKIVKTINCLKLPESAESHFLQVFQKHKVVAIGHVEDPAFDG